MTIRESGSSAEGSVPLPQARPTREGDGLQGDTNRLRRVLKVGLSQEEWVVTWVGSAMAAVPHSASVALLELEARPAASPQREMRRLLIAGRSLDDVPDEEIVARLAPRMGGKTWVRSRRRNGRAR